MRGFIRSFGDLAISIETPSMQQYYAPYKEVDKNIKDLLKRPLLQWIYVDFSVDKSKYEGSTWCGKRYYANSVKLIEITI